ncbi:hypothetical protein FJY63_10085 [Candidatus Sumerlaeota bacterium]|nr:hypothetical protein [Candidatus Sumerlaeota bacterium]
MSLSFLASLGEILAGFGSAIKEAMAALPIWAVRAGLAAMLLALAIWCLTLPRRYVMEDAKRSTWWNDPRRWAALVLAIQIALYLSL